MTDDDIVERLRLEKRELTWCAADAIERLTRERDEARNYSVKRSNEAHEIELELHDRAEAAERKVEKLREALLEIEQCYGTEPWQLTKTMKETARAVLKETESEG